MQSMIRGAKSTRCAARSNLRRPRMRFFAVRLAVCAKIFWMHKSGGGENHFGASYVQSNGVMRLRNADIDFANPVLTFGITARKWALNVISFVGKF